MSVLMQCPYCPAQIKVSDSAGKTTCPKCFKSFDTRVTSAAASGRVAKRRPGAESDDLDAGDSAPMRINPWGAGAFLFATFGLLSASVIGNRAVTLTLAGLGLALAVVGTAIEAKKRDKAWLWLGIGSVVSLATVLLTVFAGGLLNRFWGMDAAVRPPDPNKLVVIPRDGSSFQGKPLAPDEWANPIKESIRQDDIVVRLDSVVFGPVSEKPGKEFLLIHMRLASIGKEKPIVFEGFARDKNQPTLKDSAGKSYAFLEQRPRKLGAGPPHVFVAAEPKTAYAGPSLYLDYQLVFEPPPRNFTSLDLELPTSAWGRQGVYKMRITEVFQLYYYLKN